jgi:hypothetical protein
MWSEFGSALSGFGTLITTILTVVGIIGGWLFGKYRSNKRNNKSGYSIDEYKKKQNEDWSE